jgi:tumor protein p53-inducible protein 3
MIAALQTNGFGGPETLSIGEVPIPTPGNGQVLIEVHYSALNRADTLQRRGTYPPPPGASPILGLEAVGIISALGPGCLKDWKIGETVMALLSGGGNAGFVVAHEGHLMRPPVGLTKLQCAAIPETWLTAFQISIELGCMRAGDYVLIHAGASGVGTSLIQLARAAGAYPIVTCSSGKHAYCRNMGALLCVDYASSEPNEPNSPQEPAWPAQVLSFVDRHSAERKAPQHGVKLVLDPVGASHASGNLKCLSLDSRWVLYGLMGGASLDGFPLSAILARRITLIGTTLRSRSVAYKDALVSAFTQSVLHQWAEKNFQVGIDRVFELVDIAEAHAYMGIVCSHFYSRGAGLERHYSGSHTSMHS